MRCENTPVKLLSLVALALLACPAQGASNQDAMAGAILFRDRGCSYCHGDHLQGTERAPSLENVRKKLSADKITHQITHGSVQMPAFGEILSPVEINQLVAFLRAKHRPTAPPAPANNPPPTLPELPSAHPQKP